MPTEVQVSVIVVAYNEGPVIKACLAQAASALAAIPLTFELLVIDNGSSDSTSDQIRQFQSESTLTNVELTAHRLEKNLFLSGGFLEGVNRARGQWVMIYAADMYFRREDFQRYFDAAELSQGSAGNTAIGAVVGIRQSRPGYDRHVRWMSSLYNKLLRFVSGINLKDFNWACLYKTELVRKSPVVSRSIFFLPELLIRIHRQGYELRTVPAPVHERTHGKPSVSRPKVWLLAMKDLIRFFTYGSKHEESDRVNNQERL